VNVVPFVCDVTDPGLAAGVVPFVTWLGGEGFTTQDPFENEEFDGQVMQLPL
jgi:hypothetical protein